MADGFILEIQEMVGIPLAAASGMLRRAFGPTVAGGDDLSSLPIAT